MQQQYLAVSESKTSEPKSKSVSGSQLQNSDMLVNAFDLLKFK